MTRLELEQLAGNASPMLLGCPHCRADALNFPPLPRGGDAVECLGCGQCFTFAEVENAALYETRRILSRSFPFLPFDPL
ncbi:MAG: hypothetical protein ABI843_02885 [Dokdonella sp.]